MCLRYGVSHGGESPQAAERQEVMMGNLIVGAALAAIVAFVVRGMIRDKKNGKSLQCGCGCTHCGGHCPKTGSK